MNDLEVKQPPRTMMIKNLCPGLAEVGKIKIGMKGAVRKSAGGTDWQPPQKLDHFLVTTLERGPDGNYLKDEALHQRLGGDNIKLIPIRLLFDDIGLNFATRYICYYGKTVFCSGDGETATRLQRDGAWSQRPCPCGRQDPKYAGDDGKQGPDEIGGANGKGKCKINGILSTLIDGAEMVGGVWKFRTTSYNSVVGILSTLALVQRVTGGRLAGIPLNLTVSPKTTQDPIKGGQVTIQVVGIHYPGSMNTLRDTGYQIAMDEAKHGISMAHIEEQAIRMLSFTPISGIGDDLSEDVIEEFYPEEVDVMEGVTAKTLPNLFGGEPQTPQDRDRHEATHEVIHQEQTLIRERGKAAPGRVRRTNKEIAEDQAADEADRLEAEAVKYPEQDAETVQVADDEQAPKYPAEPTTVCAHPVEDRVYDGGGELFCTICGEKLAATATFPQFLQGTKPAAEPVKARVDLF
jgi:hypothetical protein